MTFNNVWSMENMPIFMALFLCQKSQWYKRDKRVTLMFRCGKTKIVWIIGISNNLEVVK